MESLPQGVAAILDESGFLIIAIASVSFAIVTFGTVTGNISFKNQKLPEEFDEYERLLTPYFISYVVLLTTPIILIFLSLRFETSAFARYIAATMGVILFIIFPIGFSILVMRLYRIHRKFDANSRMCIKLVQTVIMGSVSLLSLLVFRFISALHIKGTNQRELVDYISATYVLIPSIFIIYLLLNFFSIAKIMVAIYREKLTSPTD